MLEKIGFTKANRRGVPQSTGNRWQIYPFSRWLAPIRTLLPRPLSLPEKSRYSTRVRAIPSSGEASPGWPTSLSAFVSLGTL